MHQLIGSIGDRMKCYENASRYYLTRRLPVIIRIDGKSFHTYTKGLQKPFDRILMDAMQHTMQYLCENVQNCVFGYTQSDEITLVMTDYKTISTDAWFGNCVQKMSSVAASMATMSFNRIFAAAADCFYDELHEAWNVSDDLLQYAATLEGKSHGAVFDARVFSIPQSEVCNCLIWRQQDATRNSIQSVGQAYFSKQSLHGKSCDDIKDMLWKEHTIDWNDFPVDCKRGACCYKDITEHPVSKPCNQENPANVIRHRWVIDKEPPIFSQVREYIERVL